MKSIRRLKWIASLCAVAGSTASAQTLHPSVQFAGDLLKRGQIAEAIDTLRPRIDSDPSDCRALGLMVLAQGKQRTESAGLWLERLQAIPACASISETLAAQRLLTEQREALAKAIASMVTVGDVDGIDRLIAEAEASSGALPTVRAYVDALKGEFPLLDGGAKGDAGISASARRPSLPPDFLAALEMRRDQYQEAVIDLSGAQLATTRPASISDDIQAVYRSKGYQLGYELYQAVQHPGQPQLAMQGSQKFFSYLSENVRREFALAPLSEQALMDLMTLAFLSGSPSEIERVGSLMKRSVQKIKWAGCFNDSKTNTTSVAIITLDFKGQKLTFDYVFMIGDLKKYPESHPWRQGWTIPFSEIKTLAQSGTKIVNIKAGYKSIDMNSSGLVINGRQQLPLPLNFTEFGTAFGEVPVRQSAREYGAQIAKFIGVPPERVKLIDEHPGNGAFSFSQIWTAGMQTFSQATGNARMDQFWSDQLLLANNQASAQAQLREQGSQAWEDAKADPLLGQVLDAGNFTADIERVLDLTVK